MVLVDGPLDTPCHVWQGSLNSKGYPLRTIGGVCVLAHRHAYEQRHGQVPRGSHVHHHCEERRCINIAHLDAVTPTEHNRHHVGDSIADRMLSLLADGQPRRYRDLAAVAPGSNVGPILRRCVDAGEITKVGYGLYTKAAA